MMVKISLVLVLTVATLDFAYGCFGGGKSGVSTPPPPPQAPPCKINAELSKDPNAPQMQSKIDAYIQATNEWIMKNQAVAATLLGIADKVCKEINAQTTVADLAYSADFSTYKKQLHDMNPIPTTVLEKLKEFINLVGTL